MADRVYHKLVASLEELITYGSLGILDALAHNPGQFDFIILNVATVIRNNVTKDSTVKQVIDKTNLDMDYLLNMIPRFGGPSTKILLYHDPDLRKKIPKETVRDLTKPRELLDKVCKAYTDAIYPGGRVRSIAENVYLYNPTRFAYEDMLTVKNRVDSTVSTALISHCPLDFLVLNKDRKMTLIQSHTGVLLKYNQLSKKVFGTEDIPFNQMSLMLFGDKDHITPQIRNKKKILDKYGSKLKRMTKLQLEKIATSEFGVESKNLKWLK